MNKSLSNRMDTRTLDEFASDVKFGTLRERRLIDAWREIVLKDELFEQMEIEDYGIDNSGGLIEDTRGAGGKPDFRAWVRGGELLKDGTHLIEVKYTPCLWKATFKKHDLSGYVRHKANILLIFGNGRENPKKWALVKTGSIQEMLKFLEVKKTYPGMGGKPAVLVSESQFPTFFGQLYPWDSEGHDAPCGV